MHTTKLTGVGLNTIACLLWSVAPSNKPLNPLVIALDYHKLFAKDIVQNTRYSSAGRLPGNPHFERSSWQHTIKHIHAQIIDIQINFTSILVRPVMSVH
jgi:hypothetical protein